MNTNRAGSNLPCSRIHRRRARATSARSCSAARNVFLNVISWRRKNRHTAVRLGTRTPEARTRGLPGDAGKTQQTDAPHPCIWRDHVLYVDGLTRLPPFQICARGRRTSALSPCQVSWGPLPRMSAPWTPTTSSGSTTPRSPP
jgi:hypothetical protein